MFNSLTRQPNMNFSLLPGGRSLPYVDTRKAKNINDYAASEFRHKFEFQPVQLRNW